MPQFRRKDIWFYISIGIFLLYVLFLIYPLFSLLKNSIIDGDTGAFTLEYFVRFFSKKYYYGTIFNSIKITVAVTLLTIAVAAPLAYIMTTVKIRGAAFIRILILVSSMSAPFIGAYSWILLLGRNGSLTRLLNGAFGITLPGIYGFPGILLVLTIQFSPLIFMYVSGALKNVDHSLLEAAESMNCTGVRKVVTVLLPLIMPTILGGGLLVFMRALADFGTPMLMGEGYRTIPVLIYNEFISEVGGEDNFAAAISVLVILFASSVFLLQKYITRKKSFTMSALRPIEAKEEKGLKNVLAHGFVYLYTLIAMLPQLVVIYTSFQKTNGRLFVEGFSLDSYRTAFGRLGTAITNSFFYAGISILVIAIIAVLISYVTVRRPNLLTNTIDVFSMFPYIVPGSILGIALLVTFNKGPLRIAGTMIIMIVAYTIRRLPYTIRSSSAILHQVSISVEEASISLGASPMKTFFKVTVPMMVSGIVSGAVLSLISIITELSTSVLIYTSRTKTMSIETYTQVVRGNYGMAAALSTIMTLSTVIALLVFFKLSGKKEITM